MGQTPTLYDSLILPLRSLDEAEGQLLLQRFLTRPQYHVDRVVDLIQTLPATDGPITCPSSLLRYLAPHVGFTEDFNAVLDTLNDTQLRKLLLLAIPFWQKKGAVASLQAVARHLTGRIPNYVSWFDSRLQLETSHVAEDQNGADSFVSEDAFSSCLEMMDDGTINTILLLFLLRLVRPTNESLQVILYDFLDTFAESLDRWFHLSGAQESVVDGVLVLPSTCMVRPIVSIVAPGDLRDYSVECKFKLDDTGTFFYLRWLDQNDAAVPSITYLRFLVNGNSTVTLTYYINGTGFTLWSGRTIGLIVTPGQWYTARVETTTAPSGYPRIRTYIDNVLQYESSDSGLSVFPYTAGSVVLRAQAGRVDVDNMRIWRTPMRYVIIGPDGEEISSTFEAENGGRGTEFPIGLSGAFDVEVVSKMMGSGKSDEWYGTVWADQPIFDEVVTSPTLVLYVKPEGIASAESVSSSLTVSVEE